MSDLAKDLLSQYYGLGAEPSDKRCMSIHRSIVNAKYEEEKQVTEQASSINEDNASDKEFQKDEEENRKLSIANESYPRPSRVLDSMEDAYDSGETFDVKDIDFGPNIMCNIFENVLSEQSHEQLPEQLSAGDVPSDCIKPYIEDRETEINEVNDKTKSNLNLSFVEDTFPDNTSEASSTTAKESRKSSKNSINLPPLASKKEPVCNEIFVDFSSMDLKQFPSEILNNFWQLRMLYLSNNNLIEIPGEVFSVLKYLEWLDVRNNQLSSLPASIKRHMYLQTILLQQNKVENLPLELCTLPNLKTLQVTQNPLVMPPKDIVASGCAAILTFLRIEWNNAHPEERVEPKENKIEPKLSTILCYQSPRKNKKKLMPSKDVISNKNVSTREKRKSYKPSNRCENKGPNIIVEHRLLWFSKLRELFARQTATLQKVKDENVLKEWRRDKRSYSKAMAKAMKRNEDDIPFGFDIGDYASIFKQNSKLKNLGLKKKNKQKFLSPTDINKKINELLESLNKLEINSTDETTPRTKQNLFKNEVEKILQFQSEIQNLRKYNDVATLKN